LIATDHSNKQNFSEMTAWRWRDCSSNVMYTCLFI